MIIKKLFFNIYFLLNTCAILAQVSINSSATETWSNSIPSSRINYVNGITISNNSTLIISNCNLTMNPNTLISVQPGSKLYILNCNLTCNSNQNWNGIECMGNSNRQYTTIPDPTQLNNNIKWSGILDNNQTLINVENCTIENANCGIQSINGAIVRAFNNTKLTNCKTGISIQNYHSIDHPNINASYIFDCKFIWKNNKYLTTDLVHLSLQLIDGINIGGNEFVNFNTQKVEGANFQGIGIFCKNVNINISKGGNTFCLDSFNCLNNCPTNSSLGNINKFRNLGNAIYFESEILNKKTLSVRNSKFKNCHRDIISTGSIQNYILGNTFESNIDTLLSRINSLTLKPFYTSIGLINSEQFTIYKNNFQFTGDSGANMIYVENCMDDKCDIRNNTITNSKNSVFFYPDSSRLTECFAIYLSGNCNGIHIFCNQFNNWASDIVIEDENTGVTFESGLKGYGIFGTKKEDLPLYPDNLPGRNVFSSNTISNRYQISNLSTGTTLATGKYYWYNYGVTRELPSNIYRQMGIVDPRTTVLYSNNTNCEITCPEYIFSNVKNFKSEKLKFNIFPNPSKIFNIYINQFLDKIEIRDLNGQILLVTQYNSYQEKTEMNISHLADGIYIINIFTDNHEYSQLISCQ